MKKIVVDLFLFILGLILIVLLPVFIISTQDNLDNKYSDNSNIITLQSKSQFDSLDVLFIGNSYCYSSINPMILDSLGIKSYNLGIATSSTEFYELILNDYFIHTKILPKKIFILVSPTTFSIKSDNFESYPIHRYLETPISNLNVAIRYHRFNELLAYYRKSFMKGAGNLIRKKSKRVNSFATNKGFFNSNEVISSDIIGKTEYLYKSFKSEEFNTIKSNELVQIYKNLKSKNIEVVFYELPTNILTNYFNDSFLKDYEKYIYEIGQQAPLVRINKNLFETYNYRNIDHMNTSGAEIATKEIGRYILNMEND